MSDETVKPTPDLEVDPVFLHLFKRSLQAALRDHEQTAHGETDPTILDDECAEDISRIAIGYIDAVSDRLISVLEAVSSTDDERVH